MKPIGVFYATREGHTRRIAEHLAALLRGDGLEVEIRNLRDQAESSALKKCAGLVLAASVHGGKHEREMIEFVKEHRSELDVMPSAFISVNLSEAGVERATATPKQHAQFVADAQKVLDSFVTETGWHPKRIRPVAGALLYSKYNMLVRFVMKRIAKKSGGDTDTSRDYDYTDWTALECFAKEFAAEVRCDVAA